MCRVRVPLYPASAQVLAMPCGWFLMFCLPPHRACDRAASAYVVRVWIVLRVRSTNLPGCLSSHMYRRTFMAVEWGVEGARATCSCRCSARGVAVVDVWLVVGGVVVVEQCALEN